MKLTTLLSTGLLFIITLGMVIGCGGDDPTAATETDSGIAFAPGVNDAQANNDDGEDPSYVSSIRVADNDADDDDDDDDDNDADDDDDDDDADEAARLSELAKITEAQAIEAALVEVQGTVIETELENENGNVVYEVKIDTGAGTKEVKVDAGNGKVLHIEND
jgi:uncharacterized membrane protein YkoI